MGIIGFVVVVVTKGLMVEFTFVAVVSCCGVVFDEEGDEET